MYTINEMLGVSELDIEVVENLLKVSNYERLRNNNLSVGTIIRFSMNDGYEVDAMVVLSDHRSATFIHMECLPDKMIMGNVLCESYAYSRVREYLNNLLYNQYPDYIRERMIPFSYDYIEGDYLCIPCAEEIFGESPDGELFESTRFNPMEKCRNIIGYIGQEFSDYWLDNTDGNSFFYVDKDGFIKDSCPDIERGIRPMFQLNLL